MSFDRRLRGELQREAERIVPDVERNLGIVDARSHPRSSIRTSTMLLAAAIVAAAIIIRVGPSLPSVGGPGSSSSPTASLPASAMPSYEAIAGSYTVVLDPSNTSVAQFKLGGTWTMRLAATGEIFLSPPESFGSGTSSLSGLAFTLTGDRFRNNIFYSDYCTSVGTYTWSLAGGQLRFAPVGDSCAIRQTLLATVPWKANP